MECTLPSLEYLLQAGKKIEKVSSTVEKRPFQGRVRALDLLRALAPVVVFGAVFIYVSPIRLITRVVKWE